MGASNIVYPGVLPSWIAILFELGDLLLSSAFWFALSVTLAEIALALALGGGAGIAIGILLGLGRNLGGALERYVHYLASTPKVVFLPLFFILFGIGSPSKVAIGAFACSFPVILGTASAMRFVKPVFIHVGASFGLSPWQMLAKVYLPSLLESIVTGLRVALGVAFSACLIAEIRVSTAGLGSLIMASYDRSRFAEVYALLFVIIGFAITGNTLLDRLSRRLDRRTVLPRKVPLSRPHS
ncbi:MAG: ABC transporter permease subunit [Bauldia sp.]